MFLNKFVFMVLFFFPMLNSQKTLDFYDELIKQALPFDDIIKLIKSKLTGRDNIDLTTLQMIDASTKIPSGLLGGNLFDLGHFDECYGIKNDDIYGKYCLGTYTFTIPDSGKPAIAKCNKTQLDLGVNPQLRLASLPPQYTGLHFAICVPSTVKAEEIPGLLTYYEEFCYSKATEPKLSTGAIITTVILSFFALLVVASTSYDVCLYYQKMIPHHELLIAFSFFSNGKKIFNSSSNSDQLLCLNGIKAISMMWVVLGHEYSLAVNGAAYNFFDVQDWRENPSSMFINGATVSVDSFFVAAGLVTVYTFLKSTAKGVKFNILMFYVHRYLRLTPVLGINILIYTFLVQYLGNGPLWKVVDLTMVEQCRKAWWSTLLYIINYIEQYSCLPQAWYLSIDMQLFILSPLVLLPLVRWPTYSLSGLGILTVLGVITPFLLGYEFNLNTNHPNNNDFIAKYYVQTYARFATYVVGMMCGYFIYQIKCNGYRLKMSWWMVLSSWTLCLSGLVACVFAGFDLVSNKLDDELANGFYVGFNRLGWSLAVTGVIILCVSGYGGPINAFLSLPVFQFLAKISYSMYLIHYAVIVIRYSSMRAPFRFSNLQMMHIFWADFMLLVFLSILFCLTFESPIIILEKYIFGRDAKKTNNKLDQKLKFNVKVYNLNP